MAKGYKLTAEEIAYIRRTYIPRDKDYGAQALAIRFGVHHQTIQAVLKRTYSVDLSALGNYIDNKIDMLQNEFLIQLTEEEIDHFKSLKDDVAVDKYAHDILMRRI